MTIAVYQRNRIPVIILVRASLTRRNDRMAAILNDRLREHDNIIATITMYSLCQKDRGDKMRVGTHSTMSGYTVIRSSASKVLDITAHLC